MRRSVARTLSFYFAQKIQDAAVFPQHGFEEKQGLQQHRAMQGHFSLRSSTEVTVNPGVRLRACELIEA